MSIDERLVVKVAETASRVRLECVIIGNVAAILQDVPVHDTPRNRQKIHAFTKEVGETVWQPHEFSNMLRLATPEIIVDFVFQLSSRRKFESVRANARRVKLGRREILVASLEDVIAAKEAAGRPKDQAVLPMLKDTLRCRKAMDTRNQSEPPNLSRRGPPSG
jgi:hypothetical protein